MLTTHLGPPTWIGSFLCIRCSVLGLSTSGLFICPHNFYIYVDIAATSHGPKTQDDSEEASKSKQGITGTAYPKQHQHLIEAAVSNVAINYSFHLP